MANGFNKTNMAAWLKQRYSPDFVESMAFKDHPLLAMLKKRPSMGGITWEQPAFVEDAQAVSADFATAQTASTSQFARGSRFGVIPIEQFGLATVKGRDIRASQGNENAFRSYVTTAVDGLMRALSRIAGQNLYRTGFGNIGNVGSFTATTITLSNKEDAVNFSQGMDIVASSSADSATLRDSGDSTNITGVDYNTGVLTADTTLIAGLANSDFLFIKGNRENSATPTRRMIAGLADWVPATAPTSTAFFGVDRSTNSRLGGVRYDGSNDPVDEALINGSILLNRLGGSPDYCFMNPRNYGDLIKILGAKVVWVDVKAGTQGSVGFRGCEVYTPAGTIKVFPDRDCPINTAFMLDMSTWWLGSLGPVPDFLDHDGLEWLRQSSDDGIEIRAGYYANLVGTAPGWNANIKLG